MSIEQEDILRQSVVAIREPEGKVLGTGFFIGNDGSLLTCFHVVGNKETGELHQKTFHIYFQGNSYPANCIYVSPNPKRLDVAILRLNSGELPKGAVLLPLGKWEAKLEADREFITFGFRSADQFMGLFARGIVRGKVEVDIVVVRVTAPLLQLSPQSPGQEEIRPGMSGAPVFYLGKQRVVGMVTTRYMEREKGSENIPLAIPIDAIAEVWQPLRNRFHEQELYDQLLHVLSPAGWFTSWALERLTEELPPFFGVDIKELDRQDLHNSLLQHITNRRQFYTFIHWLQRKYPQIPVEDLVLPISYYPFVNRRDELNEIMEAGPYTVLDAPTGYGKTALLRRAEIEYARKEWLCVYVEIPDEPATCIGIAANFQEIVGGMGITARTSENEIGRELAERLLQVKADLDVKNHQNHLEITESAGITLFLDNLERLPDGELVKLIEDFVASIFDTFRGKGIRLRVCFAGRNVGQRLESIDTSIPLNIIPLKTFDFDIIKSTIAEAAVTSATDAQLRAAHLMHVTGGHPGCMAYILKAMNFAWPPDLYFQEHAKEHKKVILDTARQVNELLPADLRASFEVLSFFRRFNYQLLEQIVEKGLIDWPKNDSRRLADRLTQTYLIRRDEGFLQDEIVRRLLTIRLRWEEPKKFLELYKSAQEIYEANLQNDYYAQIIALESLFISLQLGYYRYDDRYHLLREPKLDERKVLKDNFFSSNSTLIKYLEVLAKKPNAPDIFADFMVALEKDKEFVFTLNYYLRQDTYNSDPYQELQSHLKQFKANQ